MTRDLRARFPSLLDTDPLLAVLDCLLRLPVLPPLLAVAPSSARRGSSALVSVESSRVDPAVDSRYQLFKSIGETQLKFASG